MVDVAKCCSQQSTDNSHLLITQHRTLSIARLAVTQRRAGPSEWAETVNTELRVGNEEYFDHKAERGLII